MSDTTTCASCGHTLPANASFCTNCGAQARATAAPDQPVEDATRVDTPGLHDSTQVLSPPPPTPAPSQPASPPPPAAAPWQPSQPVAPDQPPAGSWGAPPAPPGTPSWQQQQPSPAAPPAWGAQAPASAPWSTPVPRPEETTSTGGSPLGGLVAVVGGVLTAVGVFLAWISGHAGDEKLSGWDLTSGDEAFESQDPYLLLVLAVVAIAIGVALYLGISRPIVRIAAIVVGLVIVGVLVRDWLSISDVVKDNFPSSVEVSAEPGFYLAIAGGVITALAALLPARSRTRTAV